jgi:hypothetical protein
MSNFFSQKSFGPKKTNNVKLVVVFFFLQICQTIHNDKNRILIFFLEEYKHINMLTIFKNILTSILHLYLYIISFF